MSSVHIYQRLAQAKPIRIGDSITVHAARPIRNPNKLACNSSHQTSGRHLVYELLSSNYIFSQPYPRPSDPVTLDRSRPYIIFTKPYNTPNEMPNPEPLIKYIVVLLLFYFLVYFQNTVHHHFPKQKHNLKPINKYVAVESV